MNPNRRRQRPTPVVTTPVADPAPNLSAHWQVPRPLGAWLNLRSFGAEAKVATP